MKNSYLNEDDETAVPRSFAQMMGVAFLLVAQVFKGRTAFQLYDRRIVGDDEVVNVNFLGHGEQISEIPLPGAAGIQTRMDRSLHYNSKH